MSKEIQELKPVAQQRWAIIRVCKPYRDMPRSTIMCWDFVTTVDMSHEAIEYVTKNSDESNKFIAVHCIANSDLK